MRTHVTRRDFLTTALSVSVLPRLAHAQTATSINGRTFRGTRTATGTRGEGGEGLRAKSDVVIRNCQFLDLGNGAVRVNTPTNGLVIEDCKASNLYRFLEDTSSDKANPAILSNFAVRRITAREIDRGMIRIRYGSHDGVIEDVAAFAEYAVVDQSQVVPVPADMPLDRAALLACGVITGLGAVVNTAHVAPGSSVVVIGTGGVGLN